MEEKSSKLGSVIYTIGSYINSNPIAILLRFDENFFTVVLYLMASFFGTFVDQKLFLLYILYYFMMN